MHEQIPVTPQEDEAFAHLVRPRLTFVVFDETHRINDDQIHTALCVEEGCARCAR